MNFDVNELSDEQVEKLYNARQIAKKESAEMKKKAYLAMKEDIVNDSVEMAYNIEKMLKEGHAMTMKDMFTFREMMNEYGDLPANSKGGFSIENDAKNKRVRLKLRTLGDFDERADLAESHIRLFFERTLKVIDVNTFDILMRLLERKKGKLEYARVMQILAFEDRYTDDDWKKGCTLLKESFQETGTKFYLEFESKNEKGVWETINLNFSSY